MIRHSLAISIGLLLLAVPHAWSALPDGGTWFDIGADKEKYIYSEDGQAWEYFSPFTFGQSYPPGTLVYARVRRTTCDLIAQLECGSIPVVTSYVAFFHDGGCGCGGFVLEPVTLRFSYDQTVIEKLGVNEANLGITHYDWTLQEWVFLEDVRINEEEDYIEADYDGWILAEQYYVVTPVNPTPTKSRSWGTLKNLW